MIKVNEWTGCEIAKGRYHVLERIGVGSMGQVYRAQDHHLETEVVIKCPVPADASIIEPDFLKRFDLEIRSLVDLSHPHIVKIIDVGTHDGFPYVVMQYLSGGSLKGRMVDGPNREPRRMPITTLWEWLMDVAKALDFIHSQNYLHRDVKPDNILFDRYGNAFLSDFGIIKMLAGEGEQWRSSSMTAPGYLMGTPNYVAPEIIMGGAINARIDQYSLAMTVHEALAGSNFMEGSTPSATMVNQTKLTPPPLSELLPGIPQRLSDAVLRGLSKDAGARFENCLAFACEVLADVPSGTSSQWLSRVVEESVARHEPGRAACPVCHNVFQLGDEYAGEQIRCARCQATLLVHVPRPDTITLDLVAPPSPSWSIRSAELSSTPSRRSGSSREPVPAGGSSDRIAGTSSHPLFMTLDPASPRKSAVGIWLTYAMVALVFVTCGLFLRREFIATMPGETQHSSRRPLSPAAGDEAPASDTTPPTTPSVSPTPETVVVNIAYGTEKKKWLESACQDFLKTPAGQHLEINLHGLGSVEGAMAVLDGPSPAAAPHLPIHVWSPASSAYRDVLESEWKIKHGASPILAAQNLALTPMVFVMWKQRHEAFIKKFKAVNFRTVAEAMKEPEGWGGIAARSEWGLFKFGHTDPNKSNSGLQALVLMAYEFSDKPRGLTLKDTTNERFQTWLHAFERGVTRHGSSLTHSTGTLMEEMVLRGPSQYDCLISYENLVVDYMRTAVERWGEHGEFYVSYPDPNIWNEHPYYILDVPWSDSAQRKAAADFLKFLMTEPIQRRALEHGFRPGNSAVPVNSPDSPLVRNQKYGIQIDLPNMAEPPSADVVTTLLGSFRRIDR